MAPVTTNTTNAADQKVLPPGSKAQALMPKLPQSQPPAQSKPPADNSTLSSQGQTFKFNIVSVFAAPANGQPPATAAAPKTADSTADSQKKGEESKDKQLQSSTGQKLTTLLLTSFDIQAYAPSFGGLTKS